MSHVIYCAGYDHDWGYIVSALGDDGHGLAQHCCSHIGFAAHDIGITSTRQHNHYDEHFGAGTWTLEWVDDVETHAGWQAALALNKAMKAEAK